MTAHQRGAAFPHPFTHSRAQLLPIDLSDACAILDGSNIGKK